MVNHYILASDIGTSATKSSIIDLNGQIIGTAQKRYQVEYPAEGWAEQDPQVYWDAIKITAREILNTTKINPREIMAFTLDSMMLSIIPVDSKGKPLRKTILWMDVRATEEAAHIEFGKRKSDSKLVTLEEVVNDN